MRPPKSEIWQTLKVTSSKGSKASSTYFEGNFLMLLAFPVTMYMSSDSGYQGHENCKEVSYKELKKSKTDRKVISLNWEKQFLTSLCLTDFV